MTIISSRPDIEEDTISLHALSDDELELIAAFLYNTRLGINSSRHAAAAFTLLEKISNLRGDDFAGKASDEVDFVVVVTDQHGSEISRHHNERIEFIV